MYAIFVANIILQQWLWKESESPQNTFWEDLRIFKICIKF